MFYIPVLLPWTCILVWTTKLLNSLSLWSYTSQSWIYSNNETFRFQNQFPTQRNTDANVLAYHSKRQESANQFFVRYPCYMFYWHKAYTLYITRQEHSLSHTIHVQVHFLAFDFCRFCVVIRFFHPRHNGQWSLTSKDFYTTSYPLHLFSYLNTWERASISHLNVEC